MRQRDRLGHRDCPASPASGSCISTPRQCPGLYKGTSHHKVPQAVSGRDFVGTSPLHPLRNQLLCSRYLPSLGLTHHSVVAREAFQVCLVRYWVSGCRSEREVSAGGCGPHCRQLLPCRSATAWPRTQPSHWGAQPAVACRAGRTLFCQLGYERKQEDERERNGKDTIKAFHFHSRGPSSWDGPHLRHLGGHRH